MISCSKTRKQIALLAIARTDIQRDPSVRAHLEECPHCRAYLSEISGIAGTLNTLEPSSDIHASDAFHRKTLAALKACEKDSAVESLGLQLRALLQPLLTRRIGAPAFAIGAVLIVALFVITQRPARLVAVPPLFARTSPTPDFRADTDPTVAKYEIAANQSLEKLDEMITREGRKNPAPAPLYTAAALSQWISPD